MKNIFASFIVGWSLTASAVTQVKVSFLEALSAKDTTSSERFQKEYDFAVQTGKDLTKKQLAACGYELVDQKTFFDATDNLQALEAAKKAVETGSWLLIGPRRSNHYLLSVRGAAQTPSVSIMASSKEVFELPNQHLTMAQSNAVMAKTLAQETKKLKKGTTYMTIVSEDCVACLDFAADFDNTAKSIGLKKTGEMKVVGEQPSLEQIEIEFKKQSPDIVFLPNYSKVSAYLIGAVQTWKASTFFVGGDGWGDNKFGFVHESPQLKEANGITVKGFPPADKGLQYFTLGNEILKDPTKAAAFPGSGTAQALLKTIEGIRDLLCAEKPKTKEDFAKVFSAKGKKHFVNPWGVSVFNLNKGEIVFEKTVR